MVFLMKKFLLAILLLAVMVSSADAFCMTFDGNWKTLTKEGTERTFHPKGEVFAVVQVLNILGLPTDIITDPLSWLNTKPTKKMIEREEKWRNKMMYDGN